MQGKVAGKVLNILVIVVGTVEELLRTSARVKVRGRKMYPWLGFARAG